MTLTEALGLLNRHKSSPHPPFRLLLACGFTPLHLQTFLAAGVQRSLPQNKVQITAGLYGDLHGTLAQAAQPLDAVAVALEWPDLDARLGFRSLGGWTRQDVEDIEQSIRTGLARLAHLLAALPPAVVVAVSLPTLPCPPVFPQAGTQAAPAWLRWQALLAAFAAEVSSRPGCRLVNAQRLAHGSPPHARYDPAKDLTAGFPYTMPHAASLGQALAQLVAPPAPGKGLITDLDDTLWHGLVGEIGAGAVSWDLAGHGQLHGLYQKLLRSLAEQGVLLAVASKNEATVVKEAFERPDILLPASQIFPFEVHWQEKSGSVSRILQAWNVAADAVVFVDDNPREVEEVQAVHPSIEALVFPKDDPAAALALLEHLRDRFGREHFSAEDQLRLASLKSNAERTAALAEADRGGASTDALLAQAEARLTLELLTGGASDPRILELVNKTNQFNLNGVRHTPASWQQATLQPGAFVLAASYEDKFGPLGKIAVLQGAMAGDELWIQTWVMSCRAFSRRIEHACLRALLDRFHATGVRCDYTPTPRNGPLTDFLASWGGPPPPAAPWRLTRAVFDQHCPRLDHQIRWHEPPTA